jgi:predicted peptidase
MLILKRYQFYLSRLDNGDAYIDWRPDANPPIYNATVFLRMMDRLMIQKIVANTIEGKDAFDGINGFFERAYISDVDKSLDSYIIYTPHSFDPAKKYPLVVNLHGWGDSTHLNPLSPVHFDLLKTCEKRGVILVSPCGRQKLPEHRGMYLDDAETDVLQVLSLVKKYYPIDDKRVYITGNSMGGFGSYWIASRHPDLFAAIAPVCGIWSGINGFPRVNLDPLKNIPVYLFHNDLDKTVPVTESRSAYAYLKKIGAEVTYSEIKVSDQDPWDYGIFGGHNAWDYAYESTELVDWFLKYKRQ